MTYLRYELLRTVRNRRFFIISLAIPVLIYILIAAPNRHAHNLGDTKIPIKVYFMVSLAVFGSMNAVLGAGTRIAAERTTGWNRQLRLTPLSTRAYFATKVVTGYAVACATIALLYIVGAGFGVHLAAGDWLKMTGYLLVGLIPFAALGILLGHLVTADAVGPTVGGAGAFLAFLGGVWFPVGQSGVLHYVAQGLPSYWLVQASHVGLGGAGWPREGWLVILVWTFVCARLAMRAFQRDTGRA
ncbi:MAG TPA: ABC transporter permease [Gaiellaceae bacterium]|nr:ABC transporter permease [Gaiellaceae bacterium]